MRVCGVQSDPRLGDPDHNSRTICEHTAAAAADGARLVVFPEAALTGYVFDSRDEALEGAVRADSAFVSRVREASRDTAASVAFGAIERAPWPGGEDRLFNSAFLCTPAGELHAYRKVHTLCLGVDRFTTPGGEGFRVWDLPFGRVGLNICYDGSFPESARVLKLLGAQLILLPTNWPDIELKTEMVRVRARENHAYYLAVNRVGTERGVTFPGGSVAADPRGALLAELGAEPGRFMMEMDLARADANRVVEHPHEYEFDYLADRRPDAYRVLSELSPEGNPTGSRRSAE